MNRAADKRISKHCSKGFLSVMEMALHWQSENAETCNLEAR
jgi:hypothetical protein